MSVTPIRHVAVLTLVSPDDWRRPLGAVAAETSGLLSYTEAFAALRRLLLAAAQEEWPATRVVCNFVIHDDRESYPSCWSATADAYAEVVDPEGV